MEPITERDVARRLAQARGLSLSASQHLLATGIVGEPSRLGRLKAYDAVRVQELLDQPPVRADEFAVLFGDGLVVARLPRDRSIDATASWPHNRAALAGPWRIRPRQAVDVGLHLVRRGDLPVLLTVSAHVIAGATLVGAQRSEDGRFLLTLTGPGGWFDQVVGRRLRGHRGPQVEVIAPIRWRQPQPQPPRPG